MFNVLIATNLAQKLGLHFYQLGLPSSPAELAAGTRTGGLETLLTKKRVNETFYYYSCFHLARNNHSKLFSVLTFDSFWLALCIEFERTQHKQDRFQDCC